MCEKLRWRTKVLLMLAGELLARYYYIIIDIVRYYDTIWERIVYNYVWKSNFVRMCHVMLQDMYWFLLLFGDGGISLFFFSQSAFICTTINVLQLIVLFVRQLLQEMFRDQFGSDNINQENLRCDQNNWV